MKPDQESLMLPESARKIARYLIDHPAADNKDAATALRLHVNTVQPLVKQLKETVLADSVHVLDWDAIGLGLRYRVEIQINQRQLRKDGGPEDLEVFLKQRPPKHFRRYAEGIRTQERLALFIWHHLADYVAWRIDDAVEKRDEKRRESLANYADRVHIEDVVMLLGGQADLSVACESTTPQSSGKFVTDGLRMMSGINSTTTSQEMWSCFEEPPTQRDLEG